jgi:hypothetical protein
MFFPFYEKDNSLFEAIINGTPAAATLACLMTACVAGTFFTEGKASILFGD